MSGMNSVDEGSFQIANHGSRLFGLVASTWHDGRQQLPMMRAGPSAGRSSAHRFTNATPVVSWCLGRRIRGATRDALLIIAAAWPINQKRRPAFAAHRKTLLRPVFAYPIRAE